MSIKNVDLIRGKIKRVKDAIDSGGLFTAAVNEWKERDYKPYAKRIAPVATGAFQASIDVEVGKNQASIVAPVPHAPFVEYGTSKMPAQPTLVPALNATKPALAGRVRGAIARLLK